MKRIRAKFLGPDRRLVVSCFLVLLLPVTLIYFRESNVAIVEEFISC